MRFPPLVAVALLAASVHAAPQAAPVPPPGNAAPLPDVAALFPAGPGRETMLRTCSQCHSPGVAAQQRLSPDGWKAVVDQMAGFGASGTDAEFAEIAAYLAKAFPAPAK